jgi:Tol biopolymer transport system component
MTGRRCFLVDTSWYWTASSKPENLGAVYAASFDKPNQRVRLLRSDTNALYTAGHDGRGYLLWRRDGTLVAQEFDGTTPKFAGEPQPLADAVGGVVASRYMAVEVSTRGTLLYATPDLQRLTWFERSGKQQETIGEPGHYFSIRFSPDGRQIATTRIETGGRELWLVDVDRGTSRRTTFDSRGGFHPQWSPDGRTIPFIGDGVTALYRKDTKGAAPDQRLAPWPPRISPSQTGRAMVAGS